MVVGVQLKWNWRGLKDFPTESHYENNMKKSEFKKRGKAGRRIIRA